MNFHGLLTFADLGLPEMLSQFTDSPCHGRDIFRAGVTISGGAAHSTRTVQ
jgi:hypothetical protein